MHPWRQGAKTYHVSFVVQSSRLDYSLSASHDSCIGRCTTSSGVTRELYSTTFANNNAGEAGPAVMNLGIAENISDVVFRGNTFHCDVGEYGFDMSELEDEMRMTPIDPTKL